MPKMSVLFQGACTFVPSMLLLLIRKLCELAWIEILPFYSGELWRKLAHLTEPHVLHLKNGVNNKDLKGLL